MSGLSVAGQPSQSFVEAYRRNYNLGSEIGDEHVARHRELEGQLTRDLLTSTPETRWEIFSGAYTRLYEELPWLNAPESPPKPGILKAWARLVPAGASVFEIGSGKASLLRFLLSRGHRCVATEVTPERGSKHLASADGLEWHTTDGINLAKFEPAGSYDVVVSTQVIEHFHPEDLDTHFANAFTILKPAGRYLFDTPHRSAGPHDLSLVFGMDRAEFMHLREYDWAELRAACRRAGFKHIAAVFRLGGMSFASRLYLSLLCMFDAIEARLVTKAAHRRMLRRFAKFAMVPTNIWMVAAK